MLAVVVAQELVHSEQVEQVVVEMGNKELELPLLLVILTLVEVVVELVVGHQAQEQQAAQAVLALSS